GDFVVQTGWMAANKRRAEVLLLHVTLVTLASWAALGFGPPGAGLVLIFVSHLVVDAIKAHFGGGGGARPFLLDQAAHAVFVAAAAAIDPGAWQTGLWSAWAAAEGPAAPLLAEAPRVMLIAAALIAAVWAGGHAVGAYMSGLPAPADAGSLPKGGAAIGQLERLLVLMLMLIGQPAAIGFLIAAKSVLRFNEVANRDASEYVIVGTLASFAWALAVALAAQAGLRGLEGA
ncbi:MAG: DUF3307 domain-containing protein, partial [Pseudomonadota bacterium]